MSNWTWVDASVALAIHDEQLAEHGGASGVRDAGAFESAMARPVNLAGYGSPDAASLAAAYAFGLARNHPFVDGNKRTAYVVAEIFLALNAMVLTSSDQDGIMTFLALAAGDLTEDALADWFRANSRPAGVI
ncbi:MAG: type II toxin-antitoxin system death-on-curing family toxin [Sandarakinorhabdus sp.]|jgi:death-on-curing protein